jgi:dTDP-4-dehydrorhamnose reductase
VTNPPRIVVTGAAGQLGRELAAQLAPHGTVIALARPQLDIADADALRTSLRTLAPDLIVNAAAYTDVDRAETERDRAFAVNATAPAVIAEHARATGTLVVHYSTDYVFDGAARVPYDEAAATAPLNVYGASKRAGEVALLDGGASALVLRTSWVYGLAGRNFLLTIRRLAATRDELRIVDDQWGVPNWTRALAAATVRLVAGGLTPLRERAGLYHMSARGAATWFAFARAIVGDVERPRVVPIATADYPTAARRPAYAVLDTRRFEQTFGFALPPWQQSLVDCLADRAEPACAATVGCPPAAGNAR